MTNDGNRRPQPPCCPCLTCRCAVCEGRCHYYQRNPLLPNSPHRCNLPKGYRFYPTDYEIWFHYLIKKINNEEPERIRIQERNVYAHVPAELTRTEPVVEGIWVFFSPTDRGHKRKRNVGNGTWKLTGKLQEHKDPEGIIGTKRVDDFHELNPNVNTGWRMQEYALDQSRCTFPNRNTHVFCKIYRRGSEGNKHDPVVIHGPRPTFQPPSSAPNNQSTRASPLLLQSQSTHPGPSTSHVVTESTRDWVERTFGTARENPGGSIQFQTTHLPQFTSTSLIPYQFDPPPSPILSHFRFTEALQMLTTPSQSPYQYLTDADYILNYDAVVGAPHFVNDGGNALNNLEWNVDSLASFDINHIDDEGGFGAGNEVRLNADNNADFDLINDNDVDP